MAVETKTRNSNEARPDSQDEQLPTFSSEQLFGDANEIAIVHVGAVYRLKITRQGKLILNK